MMPMLITLIVGSESDDADEMYDALQAKLAFIEGLSIQPVFHTRITQEAPVVHTLGSW